MAIYEMRKADKAGTVFTTKDTYYTKEYAKQYMPMYLEGHIVVDENGDWFLKTVFPSRKLKERFEANGRNKDEEN